MMNPPDDNPSNQQSNIGVPADQVSLDVLITRLADGDAASADWEEFQIRAAAEHAPWQQLAEEQYVARKLREGFAKAVAGVEHLELPTVNQTFIATAANIDVEFKTSEEAPANPSERTQGFSWPRHLFRNYGGWAAAAAVALLWTINGAVPLLPGERGSGITAAGNSSLRNDGAVPVALNLSADQHYQKYLEAPFVQELQPLLLETGRDENGKPMVTYMRRIIERRGFDSVYREGSDAYGNAVRIPSAASNFEASFGTMQ